jgi:UDP:flavonoid glycosyltransferase YjiC (YdhE family)
MAALAHGVPLLVLPLGRDQNDNAATVEAHAVGLRLDPAATTEDLATACQAPLRDATFRDNARALGARVVRDARESPIVTELERLAVPSASASVG